MGRRGVTLLLVGTVVVGLLALIFAIREPSSVTAWLLALSMTCVAAAQLGRLRTLSK